MAEVSLLVMLAIVVVSGIIIFKIVKGIVQTLLLTSAVAAVVLAVAGGFIVMDALDLKNNFMAGDKLLLFSGVDAASGQQAITAGLLPKGQGTGAGEAPGEGSQAVSGPELEKMNQNFRSRDYAAIRGNNFKLVIVKEQAVIDALPDSLPGEMADALAGHGQNLSREAVLGLLQAAGGDERAVMLSALFLAGQGSNPLGIVSGYKKGDIYVYPETPVFKAVKMLPAQLFESAAKKMRA